MLNSNFNFEMNREIIERDQTCAVATANVAYASTEESSDGERGADSKNFLSSQLEELEISP